MASGIQRFVQGSNEYTHDKDVASNIHQLSNPIEDKLLVAGKHRRRAQKMPKGPGLK